MEGVDEDRGEGEGDDKEDNVVNGVRNGWNVC